MFSYKKATVNDIPLIRRLASETWEPTYGPILSPDQLDYMFEMMYSTESLLRQMEELRHLFFIISADGVPAGYLSVGPAGKDLFEFQKVYSLPERHGTGIGRYIIEQGVSYLKGIHPGPFTVRLNVNRHNPAVGFYTHMGFRKAGTRDFPIGNGYYMNDFIMEMEVAG